VNYYVGGGVTPPRTPPPTLPSPSFSEDEPPESELDSEIIDLTRLAPSFSEGSPEVYQDSEAIDLTRAAPPTCDELNELRQRLRQYHVNGRLLNSSDLLFFYQSATHRVVSEVYDCIREASDSCGRS
jgi:hypothetical protein